MARWMGFARVLIVDNFPTFHTAFHNRVENSYFSTTHNRVYSRVKIPNY